MIPMVYNSPMNSPSYFEIQADDTERAVQFYKDVFGWICTKDDQLPIEFWRIETEGSRGAILKRPLPVSKELAGANAFVSSMEVVDFDRVAEKILLQGGPVALPKFAVPGKCWQGYFIDTEGNTFGLFQVDQNAK
jgi:predicted enzyme related to lactoylglutathione lyase